MTAEKILLIAAYVIECVFLPLFIIKMWPKKNKISLIYKMILAAMFVSVALLSSRIADNHGVYANTMILAFSFAFLGDFFLHVSSKTWCFALGTVFFAATHVTFIVAYINEIKYLDGMFSYAIPTIRPYEIIGTVSLVVIFTVYNFIRRVSMKKFTIPGYIYATILSFMLMKAITLGITVIKLNMPNAVWGAVLIISGALFFFASDVTISYTMFDKRRKGNYPYKIFNTLTYFIGQMLIASSLLFIK